MTDHAITVAEDAVRFLKGGNATVTMRSKKTGEHFTFKVKQGWDHKNNKRDTSSPFFVSTLFGDPNADEFQFIGFFKDHTCLIAGRKGLPDAPSFKAFSWAWAHLNRGVVPDQLEILHSGRCCRCGREITNPDSVARGIGPECAKHF